MLWCGQQLLFFTAQTWSMYQQVRISYFLQGFNFRAYDKQIFIFVLMCYFLRVLVWQQRPPRSVGGWIPCPLWCFIRPMWGSSSGMKTHWHKDASTTGLSNSPFLNFIPRSAAVFLLKKNRSGWISTWFKGAFNSRSKNWTIFPM